MTSYYTSYDDCVEEGTHLVDVDDDGTCTSCGYERPVTETHALAFKIQLNLKRKEI